MRKAETTRPCIRCHSTSWVSVGKPLKEKCTTCDGTGNIPMFDQVPEPEKRDALKECVRCHGIGWVNVGKALKDVCMVCDGTGLVPVFEQIPEQPSPMPATGDVWLLVLADMEKRRQHGIAKYGTPLQVDNGRDHLRDALEEAMDLCVYLKAAMLKRDELINEMRQPDSVED